MRSFYFSRAGWLVHVTLLAMVLLLTPSSAQDAPAPDRIWFGKDYLQAGAALVNERGAFPRRGDPATGPLFQRMVDTNNFAFIQNASIDARLRFAEYQTLRKGVIAVQQAYVGLVLSDGSFHAESAELIAFGLQTAVLGVELCNELGLPLSTAEKGGAADVEALAVLRAGFCSDVVGAAACLGLSEYFSKADLSVILRSLKAAVPPLQAVCSPSQLGQLATALKAQKGRFCADDNAHLLALLEVLQAGEPGADKKS